VISKEWAAGLRRLQCVARISQRFGLRWASLQPAPTPNKEVNSLSRKGPKTKFRRGPKELAKSDRCASARRLRRRRCRVNIFQIKSELEHLPLAPSFPASSGSPPCFRRRATSVSLGVFPSVGAVHLPTIRCSTCPAGIPLLSGPVASERHETPRTVLLNVLNDPDRLCCRHQANLKHELQAACGASMVSVKASQTALCRSMLFPCSR
jgi:hypothetical protein